MKHAYLILAHNEWELLRTLLRCIDDERNDIFVHIDAKVGTMPDLHAQRARLYVLEDRVDVRWADISMVEAEYKLFEAAYMPGLYSYYHLLSGVDLPLKSQDYIHKFCEVHAGKEFIGYTLKSMSPELVDRAQRVHLYTKEFREVNIVKRGVRKAYLLLQRCLGLKINRGIEFRKGSQWCSITGGLVKEILARKDWAMQVFPRTFCPDEMLVQTICWNSPFADNIWSLEGDARGCMRAIGWKNATLYDWCAVDYDTLAASDALFSRKFNSSDMEFIHKIEALSR